MTAQVEERTVGLDKLKAENSEAKAKEEEYLKEIEQLRQSLTDRDVVEEMSLLKKQLAEKEVEVQRLSTDLETLKPHVEEGQSFEEKESQWKQEIEELQARISVSESAAATEIKTLNEKISEQAEDIERLKASLQAEKESMEDKIKQSFIVKEEVMQSSVVTQLSSQARSDVQEEIQEAVVQPSQSIPLSTAAGDWQEPRKEEAITGQASSEAGRGTDVDLQLKQRRIEELEALVNEQTEEIKKLETQVSQSESYSPFSTSAGPGTDGDLQLKQRIEELEALVNEKTEEIEKLQQQVDQREEYSPFSTAAGPGTDGDLQLKERRIEELEVVISKQTDEIRTLQKQVSLTGEYSPISTASSLREAVESTFRPDTSYQQVSSDSDDGARTCYSPACANTVARLESELKQAMKTISGLTMRPSEVVSDTDKVS